MTLLSICSTLVKFAVGAIFGALCVLYALASRVLEHRRKARAEGNLPTLFINLVVTNKEELIKEKVRGNMEKKFPIGRKMDKSNKLPTAVGSMANKAVSDDKFIEKLGSKMAGEMPDKFAAKKMATKAEMVYSDGTYAVICVTILSVDARALIGQKVDKSKMSKLNKVVELLGRIVGMDTVEFAFESQMTELVVGKMKENMPSEMKKEMKEKGGVEAEIVVKTGAEQALFFYSLIQTSSDDKGITGERLSATDKGSFQSSS